MKASIRSELFQNYLRSCRISQHSITTLVRADSRASRDIEGWWAQIVRCEFGDDRTASELKNSDIEEIFAWLFENPVDESWKRVFLVLARRVMFDERVFDLLSNFLSEYPNFENYSSLDKMIVGRLIELYNVNQGSSEDVSNILYDELISGNIFYLCGVVSSKSLIEFVQKVSTERYADVNHVVDSIIDYISGDTAHPSVAMPLFWFIADKDSILEEYPEKSFYEGMTRLDRLIIEFHDNPRFQLNLSKEGRDFLRNFGG